jgi:aspartyl-tRNA(Asn)/glutamyl-tRNA(Gln) amidotransferase subunit B
MAQFPIKPHTLASLIDLVDQGQLSYSTATQKVFPALLAQPTQNPKQISKELNLLIDISTDILQTLIHEILNQYPDKVKEYKNGKKGVLGLFMGEIMKRSRGKIDPHTTNKLIVHHLETL